MRRYTLTFCVICFVVGVLSGAFLFLPRHEAIVRETYANGFSDGGRVSRLIVLERLIEQADQDGLEPVVLEDTCRTFCQTIASVEHMGEGIVKTHMLSMIAVLSKSRVLEQCPSELLTSCPR